MENSVIQAVIVNLGIFVFIYCNYVCSQVEHPVPIRVEDKAFPSGLKIYNRTVTCEENYERGRYRSHTYTCRDMRVSGMRLAYGYHWSIKKNDHCNETKGFDEIAEICKSLMRSIGSREKLWAASVSKATCDFIDEGRLLLNMTTDGGFRWDMMKPGYGWVDTLQCMALPED